MRNYLNRLWKDESAISATEYGIIAAILAVGLVVVIRAFGTRIGRLFQDTQNRLPE